MKILIQISILFLMTTHTFAGTFMDIYNQPNGRLYMAIKSFVYPATFSRDSKQYDQTKAYTYKRLLSLMDTCKAPFSGYLSARDLRIYLDEDKDQELLNLAVEESDKPEFKKLLLDLDKIT